MDWKFWIPTTVALISAVITAIIAYIKKDNVKIKWWVILIPIGVAIAAVIFSWSSNQDANRALKLAHDNDSIYKSKFNEEIDSSKIILSQLKLATGTARTILGKTDTVMIDQKTASQILSQQVNESKKIKHSLVVAGKRFKTTIDSTTSNIERNMTGGDGYILLKPSKASNEGPGFSAENMSKNILPNVIISFTNYTAIIRCNVRFKNDTLEVPFQCYWSNTLQFTPELFSPRSINYPMGFAIVIDTSGIFQKFIVRIITPKNTFIQTIIYRYIDHDNAQFAYALYKIKEGHSFYFIKASNQKKLGNKTELYWKQQFPNVPDVATY
jgi:hypothetical protein